MTGNCNKTATTQTVDRKRVVKMPKNALPDTLIKRGRGAWADARARREREETHCAGTDLCHLVTDDFGKSRGP